MYVPPSADERSDMSYVRQLPLKRVVQKLGHIIRSRDDGGCGGLGGDTNVKPQSGILGQIWCSFRYRCRGCLGTFFGPLISLQAGS